MEPEKIGPDLTRRKMLKRIGAGTAIAWAAPALTSVGGQAFAQQASPACGECVDACVSGVCGRAGETDCVCAVTVRRACRCFTPICFGGQACDAENPACPEGFACVNAECCGASFCAALCGTPIPAGAATIRRWG